MRGVRRDGSACSWLAQQDAVSLELRCEPQLNFLPLRLTLMVADEVVPLVRQTREETGTGLRVSQAAETMGGRKPTFYLV